MATSNGLKALKIVKRPKAKRCDGHYWLWDHAIYSADRSTRDDAFTVHRQCQKCGRHEVCRVTTPAWSNATASYELPDLRK